MDTVPLLVMLLTLVRLITVLPVRVMPLPTVRTVPDPVSVRAALVPTPLPPMVRGPVPRALALPATIVPPFVMIVPPW